MGDWREEIISPTVNKDSLLVFSTWFPCDYAYPWLMTDHVYQMSAINQNIGYNQPTQLGYYLGSDKPGSYPVTTGITAVKEDDTRKHDGKWYNLMGIEVKHPSRGIFIHNGRKEVVK